MAKKVAKVAKKELKNLSFEVASEVDKSFDDERFIKMRLRIMHTLKNPNQSYFSDESVDGAKHTLANIPILANVVIDEDGNSIDFGAHDIEIEESKFKEGEYKLIFKEQPIGLIPETNNYEIVEFEGRNYVVADGYIWKNYAGYAEDLIESKDETKLSMEIMVSDYAELEEDKNYFDIKSYKYTGITFLGDKYGTGMLEAKAEKVEFNLDENKELFISMAEELKFALENHSKDVEPNVDTDVQVVENEGENVPSDNASEFVEGEVEVVVEVVEESKKFMLNSQKRDKLRSALSTKESTDDVKYYCWVMDFDEKYVYFEEEMETEDNYEWKNYRCEYSESGAEVSIFENTKVEIFRTWLTQEEMDKLQTDREAVVMSLNEKIAELETSVETFKADAENKDKTIDELATFKTNVEKEIKASQVEDLLGEFESVLKDESEFVELKAKAIDMEITELEKELYALEGKLKHDKKNKAKEKKFNYSRVAIDVVGDGDSGDDDVDRDDKVRKYYGSASKYFKK